MQQPPWGPYPPVPHAPYGAAWGPPQHVCQRCGRPGPDWFLPNVPPTHRACIGLGPDTLSGGWIAFAYVFTILVGWTFLGALLASLPYYQWRRTYPEKAKRYNRHVWIAFAISLALRVLLWAAVATPHDR